MVLFSSCISYHPVYLASTPQNIYNSNTTISGGWGTGYSSEEFGDNHSDFCLQMKYNSGNSECGVSPYFVPERSTSAGVFIFNKWWLKGKDASYPYGVLFTGVQPSFVQYVRNTNEIYYPMSFDVGFCPGFYRNKFSAIFILRGGGGIVESRGHWYHLGVGLQTHVSITSNIFIGGNFEYVVGLGQYIIRNHNETDPIIALAAPFKIQLIYKLSPRE
jgi:hypothetical protein